MPSYVCYLIKDDYLPRKATADDSAGAAQAAAAQVRMAGRWVVVPADVAATAEFVVSESRVYSAEPGERPRA